MALIQAINWATADKNCRKMGKMNSIIAGKNKPKAEEIKSNK